MMLLLALFAPWAANAQETVTIGDGTSAYYYTPIGTYYNYSITEQLYTADEIGMAGTISSVSFYWAYTTAKDFNITMYMANVDAADLSTGISLAEADEVFIGTLSAPATAGWVTIDLDTPFAYDGTSNLLIGVNKTGGATWFSGNTWQYTEASNMARYAQQDGSAYTTSTTPGTTTAYRSNIQLVITPSGGPVCDKPETMEASNVTANSATLTWTGGSGTYNVEYQGGTVTEWTSYLTNTTATTANLTGLTPGTNYSYRVQSVCSDGVSGWKNVSFMTMFGIPLVEGFGTAIPTGWAQYTGKMDTIVTGGTLAPATYGWNFGASNGVFDNHARTNIYGTSCVRWLVMPTVTMEDNVQLSFDLALTAYSGTLGAPATNGTDDKFVVLINAGRGWSVLRQWDNAGSEYVYNNIACTAVGENVTIDLSSYAGQQIAIAFYAESTTNNADNNLHIDNVSIDYIPDCAKPTGLAVSDVTAHGATVTWTSDAAAWQIQLGEEAAIDVNEPTYTFPGLTPETAYSVKVRANCDGAYSEWTAPVSFTTGIACPAPTVAVNNITTTTADVNCTNTEASVFNIQLINPNVTPADTSLIENVAMPYTLPSLTDNTSYKVRVQAICGGEDGESDWSSGTTFTTAEICPEGMVCIGAGTATSTYLPAHNYYKYSLTEQIYTAAEIGMAGQISSIEFYKASTTAMAKDLVIYMVSTTKDEFESTSDWIPVTASDIVYQGTVTFVDNDWTNIELQTPFNYDGTSNLCIVVDNNTGSYVSSTNCRVFTAEKNQALYQYNDSNNLDPTAATIGTASGRTASKNRIRIAIGEPPACPKPSHVAVNYESGITATVTWEGEATSYNIDVNGIVTEGVTSPYPLESLELATEYAVMVQANCGSDLSEWTTPVSFTTDACMPEDMIIVNYALADSYGDGWNGNYIFVMDETCTVVEMLTIESGSSATGTLKVCGSIAQFMWYAGSYPGETSWTFTNAAGDVLFSGTGSTSMSTGDVLYTIDNNPYSMPADIEVVEVGPYGAKLSWTETGTATAWQIGFYNDDDELINTVDANTNPFTVTGLTAETDYYVKVRATGANGTSVWPCLGASFTTLEGCGAPAALDVNPYPVNAIVDWTAWEEGYDIEWSVIPATRDGGLWVQYDNGTLYTNIGNSTAGWRNWGVKYPAEMLQGNKVLTKIALQENANFTVDSVYTINIYNGDSIRPTTLVATQNVTPGGAAAMVEITLDSPVTINPFQNLWITVKAYGTYIMTACQVNNPDNQWWDNNADGVWTNMGEDNANLADYGWMIRAYVEGYDPADFNWSTTVEGILPPYTIENLEPETTYFVRVKASCGTDWIWAQFTTPSACDAPNELEATNITYNAANLNWIGYQDSYNVRWWSPAHEIAGAFNVADFTQIGEDYTAADTLVTYNIDLSAYSGVGNIAIRHYNVTDMFRLNVDDIVVTNAGGDVVVSEDFESGAINLNWLNKDVDGDGYVWDIWNITSLDANDNPVGNGNYCATSASYNSAGALTPDNWLIIPNVELGGTLTFVARGQDPSWAAEVFGVFVSTTQLVIPGTDPVVVEGITNPYELTGLTPETPYAFQVQGINPSCTETSGLTEWSEMATFTTGSLPTQTIALSEGWNWVSFNMEITLDNLKAALVEAAPAGTEITIKSKTQTTTYKPATGRWSGRMTWDLSQMYLIQVEGDCEIALQGFPIDPAVHPVTILGGGQYTYFAFPYDESMTLTNAFAGFAVQGDRVKAKSGNAEYQRRWMGTSLTTLEPGQGYMYQSATTAGDRTFVFPSTRKANVAPKSVQQSKKAVNSSFVKNPHVTVFDLDLNKEIKIK